MIEVRNLSRRYGDFTAVDDVSFAVDDREIVGMLGPNGAGKTTAIRMITGFLPPTRGQVTVAGLDLLAAPREARRQIGYLPENVALYPEMRVDEYLAYRARLEGMPGGEARTALGEAVERCLLTDVRHQIIGTLSKGYRQRVGLAAAILHRPRVLVLDEPTVGLDPKQIIAIRELIRELGRERTLLISTHILPEVELLCRRVLIIARGRIVAQGTPESLRASVLANRRFHVTVKGAGEATGAAAEILAALPGVASAVVRDGAGPGAGDGRPSGDGTAAGEASFTVEADPGADPREAIFGAAVERGWRLLELAEEKVSLEDIFVRLTAGDSAEGLVPGGDGPPTGGGVEASGEDEAGEGDDFGELGEGDEAAESEEVPS